MWYPSRKKKLTNKQHDLENIYTWKKKLGFEFDQSKTKTQPAQSVILNFSFILFTPTFYCFTRHRGLCIFLLLTILGWLCEVLSTITSYLVSGYLPLTSPARGSFSKSRRRRQRERHQTKGLMSRTIAVHARFETLYISLPSSAKQQREMTKFYVFWRTRTAMANFCIFFRNWTLWVHI